MALTVLLLAQVSFSGSVTAGEGDLGSAIGRFNSVKVLDIDGDGNQEIIFGNYEGQLRVMTVEGKEVETRWVSRDLGSRLWGLAVGDVDNDGTREIVTGNGEGNIHIFDGKTHEQEWKSSELGSDAHGIEIADLEDDGAMEIIVGVGFRTDRGRLYVFNGTTREQIWKSDPFDSRIRGLAVADLDGDGRKEIIVGSGTAHGDTTGEGYIRIIDSIDWHEVWRSGDLKGDVCGLVVSDVDSDDVPEIIAGTGYRFEPGRVHVFDGVSHEIEWKSKDIGPKVFGLAVGDVDSDGAVEIVVGNQAGYVYIYDGRDHSIEWKSGVLGNDVFGLAVGNLNDDDTLEIIVCTGGYSSTGTSAYTMSHLYVYNGKTHTLEWESEGLDRGRLALQVMALVAVLVVLAVINVKLRYRDRADGPEQPHGPGSGPPSESDLFEDDEELF